MANKTATLYINIKKDGKWKFCPVSEASNGRLEPGYARVNGRREYHEEGTYYVRWYEGSKPRFENVGKDPTFAAAQRLRREALLNGEHSKTLEALADPSKKRLTLADAIAAYIVRVRVSRSDKTQNEFELMLPEFAEVCGKKYVDDVRGEDLMQYAAKLRYQGFADRTVENRVSRVSCFLKKNGITELLDERDRQSLKPDEKVVEAYNTEELKLLFAACDEEEKIVFHFFLGSGCREAEVAHATWRDVNFHDKTFTVHSKRKQGFGPKDRAERTIPLPDSLMSALKAWRKKRPDNVYLFPNQDGRPNGHFLRMLKKLAKKAGLNCGECKNVGEQKKQSCRTAAVCGRFELHKFRRSFATMHHEAGVPVRTIQDWLGHSDLETTLRYLQISDRRSVQTRQWVNKSFAGIT